MIVIHSVAQMQQYARDKRGEIALVPTMGYLHEGHASLMVEARKRAKYVVASIFVNPTQFGVNEDLDSYPRDLEHDKEIAAKAGVDVIFAPIAAEMYPEGYQSYLNVEEISAHLCGASRPGHFRGVTTVVAKLFNIVAPKVALFGKKDFQQLAVLRRMVQDFNFDLEIVGMPIVREADGLAMSSRNTKLSPVEREKALCLSRSIAAAKAAFRGGERSVAALQKVAAAVIEGEKSPQIDYLEFRDQDSLLPLDKADERTLLALAVRVGSVRLIDNSILGED
ncbi:pantoate--beta-alanine ligase [Citrifermentans bemidjiense Bem]|uniref:Pantothenate synthetase n=1 Tax=Citrifermentans bemidjiense (strain ATCC BAA-1014 / DSM 16622 / JCM 12645 / Bem) TaxID=404380 RepID=PANC_CITBB|nr:pantoate--beta-alanine ligase [Citrifermentans bemidjiense]B5E845.1 RecName: Full=Pantothenate synthetase; Short=PS; AltName: Full=Pantoate--beta-alanine ligase; AltName: Full=Pantoate-activating enzyme [Citrifermentans bemidjiense Bem]ACH40014.1 pantoate--beta-alanine ligase [Citrifermentans bemidjiense Bem]